MKQQVIIIHGGDTHRTRREYLTSLKKYKPDYQRLTRGGWKENLGTQLGRNFEVLLPKMPNSLNAYYEEWKIMFRRVIPLFKGKPILVGHSLGGIFLAKYLAENKFPKRILATFLIAAPYENDFHITGEWLRKDFALPKNLKRLERQGSEMFLYQCKDDKVVPFFHFEKYQRALPHAKVRIFKNRGHFGQATFPELVKAVKGLTK